MGASAGQASSSAPVPLRKMSSSVSTMATQSWRLGRRSVFARAVEPRDRLAVVVPRRRRGVDATRPCIARRSASPPRRRRDSSGVNDLFGHRSALLPRRHATR